MEASRASGYGKVVMKYGGLQCQAFVPGQEEPQPDPWSKIQQARIAAMQAELARRAASSSTRAVKERARKKAQASRKKAEIKKAAAWQPLQHSCRRRDGRRQSGREGVSGGAGGFRGGG